MTLEPPSSSGVRGLHRALSLDAKRRVRDGSAKALAAAIRRGADLHIGTEFRHNEHVDTSSDNPETVRELAEFRTTYLVEDRWTAGIMTLRQPVSLPDAFGPRPSMSFFLYNQDGTQAHRATASRRRAKCRRDRRGADRQPPRHAQVPPAR